MDESDILEVEADELLELIESQAGFVLLDVRTDEEVRRSKISGSMHLELPQIKSRVEKLLPDKDKPVYIYCLTGSRSLVAAQEMSELGYQQVYSLKGGLLGWRSKGYI